MNADFSAGLAIDVPASAPHCLHGIAGRVSIRRKDGAELGTLERGESAFVPAGVRAYRVEADAPAAVVRVTLPPYVD